MKKKCPVCGSKNPCECAEIARKAAEAASRAAERARLRAWAEADKAGDEKPGDEK
jgi:hypothetical protein